MQWDTSLNFKQETVTAERTVHNKTYGLLYTHIKIALNNLDLVYHFYIPYVIMEYFCFPTM